MPAELLTVITTVGYPIASALILMWYIYHLTAKHEEETAKLTEAINHNTLVLQQLTDRMDAADSGHHAA